MSTEITYERNLVGSYMKIEASEEADFDEKMLLRKKLPGLLQMEKCYVDGVGQYWYNISGKQSLDASCQIKTVSEEFLEQIIHSICAELSIIEQHLINPDCLRLEPELIYISNNTKEFVFTVVPGTSGEIQAGFRELMEYLLTRIDHTDEAAVRLAYSMYEKTLEDGYSIENIHEAIIEAHMVKKEEEAELVPVAKEPCLNISEVEHIQKRYQLNIFDKMLATWKEWKEKIHKYYKANNEVQVVYPDEPVKEEVQVQAHPTICLSDYRAHPEGILLYEGYEHFSNIQLQSGSVRIGQCVDADVVISKDTVSRYHARIECEEHEYYIEDLNSTNGTYINDKALSYKERRHLNSNDIVRFADVKYRFV